MYSVKRPDKSALQLNPRFSFKADLVEDHLSIVTIVFCPNPAILIASIRPSKVGHHRHMDQFSPDPNLSQPGVWLSLPNRTPLTHAWVEICWMGFTTYTCLANPRLSGVLPGGAMLVFMSDICLLCSLLWSWSQCGAENS
jgi:hypothetical protein